MEGCSPNLPIVAVTACAVRGDRERFLAAGSDEYLSKTFDTDEVEGALWRGGAAAVSVVAG